MTIPDSHAFRDDPRWQTWRRHGPVGLWIEATGGFATLASHQVWFGSDGEGWVQSASPLFGSQRVTFRWRPFDDAEIEILPLEWPAALGEVDGPADDEPAAWQRVRWEAVSLRTDTGPAIAMRERDSQGFWILPDPLVWLAPVLPRG
jgi:hypothetical protein